MHLYPSNGRREALLESSDLLKKSTVAWPRLEHRLLDLGASLALYPSEHSLLTSHLLIKLEKHFVKEEKKK